MVNFSGESLEEEVLSTNEETSQLIIPRTNQNSLSVVKDNFFFYTIYKEDKDLGSKLLKTYCCYAKNKVEVVKEIIDMAQLVNNQIINLENFLGSFPQNSNYATAFTDFVRRMDAYEKNEGTLLFKDAKEMTNYVVFLSAVSKPKPELISKVMRMIYRPTF